MGAIDDVAQKVKGKAQQIKGEVEESTGHHGQGLWDKTKGKANEMIADIKLNSRNNNHIN